MKGPVVEYYTAYTTIPQSKSHPHNVLDLMAGQKSRPHKISDFHSQLGNFVSTIIGHVVKKFPNPVRTSIGPLSQ